MSFRTFHYVDAATNALSRDALHPEPGIPQFKHSAVAVEPAAEGGAVDAD